MSSALSLDTSSGSSGHDYSNATPAAAMVRGSVSGAVPTTTKRGSLAVGGLQSPMALSSPSAASASLNLSAMDMNAAEFNIPTPDISDVAAPEMRSLYLDLLERYKRVCSDKSQLFNEMRRRQEAGLRKESEFRMRVTTLEERVVRTAVDPAATERRMTDVRAMYDRLLQQIGSVQQKTVSVLKEQEKDLLRAFRARLGELTNELKKERMKGEAGAQEWIDKCNKQARELTQLREMSEAMSNENAALLKEQARLSYLMKTQEDDRQFLVKQLVTIKKENARLRLAVSAQGTGGAGGSNGSNNDTIAADQFASLALLASSDLNTPMHSSLIFQQQSRSSLIRATTPASPLSQSQSQFQPQPQPPASSARGVLTSPLSARPTSARPTSARPTSARPTSARPHFSTSLSSPSPTALTSPLASAAAAAAGSMRRLSLTERPASASVGGRLEQPAYDAEGSSGQTIEGLGGSGDGSGGVSGEMAADKERRYAEVIRRLKLGLETEQKKARALKHQFSAFLNDRSEIEGFLRASIDEVKHEIAARMTQRIARASQRQQSSSVTGTGTGLGTVSAGSGVDAVSPALIGLKDFAAEDRERFIQLVLANQSVLDALAERAFPRSAAMAAAVHAP